MMQGLVEKMTHFRASCMVLVLVVLFNLGTDVACTPGFKTSQVPGDDDESPFAPPVYPVMWRQLPQPSSPQPPSPPNDDNKKPFSPPAYPVMWRHPPHPSSPQPPSPPNDDDKKPFPTVAYPVEWRRPPHPTNPQPHSPPNGHNMNGMLFLMKNLYPGAILPEGTKLASGRGVAPSRRFISKADADVVPFDYAHLETTLAMFKIDHGSKKASQVADTLRTCGEIVQDADGDFDEPRTCATSRQAVVNFVTAALATSAPREVTTVVRGGDDGGEPLRYVVAPNGVTWIGDAGVVPCHPMPYPYEVYYCHRPSDAVALTVELAGVGDGSLGATAVAVCHMNTTSWDAAYFDMLNAQRGEVICHFMPKNYVLWLR